MAKLPTQELDVKTKIYNLTIEQAEAEGEKKSVVKTHTENIKRIKAEIKDILLEEEESVNSSQKPVD